MYSWQQWLEKNYKVISYWAKKWHAEEWRELLAFLTLYLEKNWSRFSKIPDGEQRIKFLQTWMKNNVNWYNSEFRKSISVNHLEEDFAEYWGNKPEKTNHILSSPTIVEYTILSEDISQDVKEFIIDLKNRYSEIEMDKILKVRQVYLTLKSHEKVLYDLYITQMMSIRGVAKMLNLPPSAVYGMINELKNKIKEQCG
jgi:DNA-directed RNA polymerase specialized sigma subunit